jgi:aldehyde dehydrogenase (NAD+)
MDASLSRWLDELGVPATLSACGDLAQWWAGAGATVSSISPIDGQLLCSLSGGTVAEVGRMADQAQAAFLAWRRVPAPRRGEFVAALGRELRRCQIPLAQLVTAEAGKIWQEALGEVREMIDICDFAVGLSRQLYGLTMASERPHHRLTEYWHPLGPVAVISAFNFPVAVWSWNAMLALVCGDPVVWKPSEKTPLTAIACQAIAQRVAREFSEVPPGLLQLVIGDAEAGASLAADHRFPLVSATGSVRMGKQVAPVVAARFGRSLLELGGNNAAIVTPSADLELATRAIVFSAVGTCGQRCTTLRRLIVHELIYDTLLERLHSIYQRLPIGDPRSEHTLVGPLVDRAAYDAMQVALQQARLQGGQVFGGNRVVQNVPTGGYYVEPALVAIDWSAPIVQQETFAPILYVGRYREFEQAIEIQNAVPQGLSSTVFTRDLQQAETFCSPWGSDCGIVNVNIGTSGAEIGGAFGGEKETGGGRESGSDAWKAYMRRATSTVNYGNQLPLAQGIRWEI